MGYLTFMKRIILQTFIFSLNSLNSPISKLARAGLSIAIAVILALGAFTPSSPVLGAEKTFRVDFRDQDIQDFIKAMSGIIGKNIIIDERVKGKITVISPDKIPVSMAYSYMSTVLALKGFGIIDVGVALKIVPLKDGVAISPLIFLGREPLDPDVVARNEVITQIVPLYNGKPSRLAGILKRITNATTDIIDYDEMGTLIFTGGAQEIDRLVKIAIELDPSFALDYPAEGSFGNVHIYRLENMQADKIEATLRKISLPEPGPESGGSPEAGTAASNVPPAVRNRPPQVINQANLRNPNQKIDIVAHKESNSLIFIGTEDEFSTIKQLIKRLDLPRDQVLLEVLIVEVAADDTNSFGIDWRFVGPGSGVNTVGQFNSNILAESGLITQDNAGSFGGNDILGINTLVGFSLGFMSSTADSLYGIIQANISNDNFMILSAPQILTLDNQEAEINVGEDIPIITGNRKSGGGTAAVDTFSYEYKSVGVQVKFTPQINKNGMVTLDLYQEITAVSGATEDVTRNPRFTKRDIKTAVRVNDGQTIVIGGLVSSDKSKTLRKIPLLGDIPLAGYLFKRTSTIVTKTNLLVFITPHILSSKDFADKLTNEAYDAQITDFSDQQMAK